MKRCPITYEIISDQESYSQRGLRLLSPQLKNLQAIALSAAEQRTKAMALVGKMSIQGVQTKLNAQLKIKEGRFKLVEQQGYYILKPQSADYPELPENEAITMTLAAMIGIDIPVHGLIYSKDGSMTYFIKRFDRIGHNKRVAMEDFAQLLQLSRDTKYSGSMEKVVKVINRFCSFPKIECLKLFKLTLFNFLIGNEDMHLKNFSLITHGKKTTLSPAYDLVNSTIALPRPKEEIALPLNGKKNNLTKNDLIAYFAAEKLALTEKAISTTLDTIKQALSGWRVLINNSFLSPSMKERYLKLLDGRCQRLFQ